MFVGGWHVLDHVVGDVKSAVNLLLVALGEVFGRLREHTGEFLVSLTWLRPKDLTAHA